MKKSELEMKVKSFRTKIEEASQTLPDEKAQTNIALYPRWSESAHYTADYRVQYNDVVYKCLQEHDSQPTWTPTDAPSLWAKVLVPSPDVIPDWEQPDSTNPYMIGDKVRYKDGHVYESLIDNNVWSPESYPQGWRMIE
jgi:hypothetical protein